jgi:hypothetical protein
VLGFKSKKQLTAARQKAIDAGWLHYERQNDRAVGNYWTEIPSRFEALSDLPIENGCVPNSEPETESIPIIRSEFGTHSGTPSIPIPKPIKSGQTAKRFIHPSIQDVEEYAKTEGLKVDASAFVDYYESVGWIVGKGKSMKDWKASARNWARQNWARNTTPETLKTNQRQREYVN